ncbi:MAG: glutamate--tRNA ligase [Candidatus Helarchaeota archaeon]
MIARLKEIVRAFALINAAKYKGKANTKAVLGQIFNKYSICKKNPKEIIQLVEKVVTEINKFSLAQINAEIEKLPPEFIPTKRPEEKKELPPLLHAEKSIVMRLAPFPSGPLHIGNARMVILNDTYVKRYNGKLLLVFDDTIGSEEKQLVPDAYDMIIESLEWLGVKYHQIIYKSDRIAKTYEYCQKAIEMGIAYICTCAASEWRDKFKNKKRPCPHRSQSKEKNLDEWGKMLDGFYGERQAVARLKLGMDLPNPAIRDPVIMRISNREHPRVGLKYIVWPLLEFSWAIDDHLLGITHILRGKDLIKEDIVEQWLWERFGWPIIDFIHYGLIKFKGLKLSKTQSRKNIEAKTYIGWHDPRTWSLQSLMKRGIQPLAIREAILSLGLSKTDIEYSPDLIYAINKKFIDPKALRYFFVPNPVKLRVRDIPFSKLEAQPLVHPEHEEMGKRIIPISISEGVTEFFIPGDEFSDLQIGEFIRLKDLFNLKLEEKNDSILGRFESKAMEDARDRGARIVQWVPSDNNVKISMIMDDGRLIHGFGEPNCRNLKTNQIIQFERVGFAKVQEVTPQILVYFAHK